MPRPAKPRPSYRLHAPSGQAVVTIPKPGGGRRDVYLGRYKSPESYAEYERICAQLVVGGASAVAASRDPDLTVNELLVKFLAHADAYYRHPDGSPTTEPTNFRHNLRPLRRLYGHTPAAEFGPLALKTVRQRMINDGWCRKLVNQAVGRVKAVFKWAASEELIPATVHQALATVAGLAKGRTTARESAPVLPVEGWVVDATLPHLNRHVAAMVRVQRLTGCRPGEVCRLCPSALDTSAAVWTFSPLRHKNAHRGKPRVIPIGPQAQAVLAPFLSGATDPDAPLFSPLQAREERYQTLRAARKSKVTPSQVNRRSSRPQRLPATAYTPGSYIQAVRAGVKKANTARRRAAAGQPFTAVPHWHPNQLRHTFATEVRKAHGLEAAQVLLGHSKADVTQVYAERDLSLAVKVAELIG